MALDPAKLANEIESAWAMPTNLDEAAKLTEAGQIEKLGNAIATYLEDATVSLTGSSITFPALESFKTLFQFNGTTSGAAISMEAALVAALTGAIGGIDGIPSPPGTSIVSEIAAPPIPGPAVIALSAMFANAEATLRAQAKLMAAAIHGLVTTILFIVIQMVPGTPPVPVPVPAVPLL